MNKLKSRIKLLGIYQIAGGIIGIIILAYSLIYSDLNNEVLYLLLFPFLLFIFSIYAGNLLILKNYEKGLKASKINQSIQIFGFKIGGLKYLYASGIIGAIQLDLTDDIIFRFLFWVSHYEFEFVSDSIEIFISVNIVAIILLSLLIKLQKKYQKIKDRFDVGTTHNNV